MNAITRKPWLLRGKRGVASGPPGATLDLSFMTPGTLDPRITFTRASTGTYFDSTGTMQTAAVNQPRWDYDPMTLQLRGLLLEDARTNLWLQSADANNAAWAKSGNLPVTIANQTTAPDGTLTAARVQFQAVSAASFSTLSQTIAATVNPYTFSVWLKGSVGGETVYIMTTANAVLYYSTACVLTTAWRRFTVTTPNLTAASWFWQIGYDRRDATQTTTPGCTVFVWGAQVELGAFPTSFIPTTAAAVTRAIDSCLIPPANMSPWFASPGGSWFAEFDYFAPAPNNSRVLAEGDSFSSTTNLFLQSSTILGQYNGVTAMNGTTTTSPNTIVKAASAWSASVAKLCANGGVVNTSAALTTGYPGLVTFGLGIMAISPGGGTGVTSGHIRRVTYWPRALSDTEMQQVTT